MHIDQSPSRKVPETMQQALDGNVELKEALLRTPTSRRFQAMVLGLTTLQQLNERGQPVEPFSPMPPLQ